jgi:hypothetical protein
VSGRFPGVAAEDKSVVAIVQELKDLTIAYAKQETIDPLKGTFRFVALGVAGSALTAVGVLFLALGLLRAMQTETDYFHGHATWIPYVATIVGLVVLSVLAALAIKGRDER